MEGGVVKPLLNLITSTKAISLLLYLWQTDIDGEFEDARTTTDSGSRNQSPTLKPVWLASPTVGDLKLPPSSPYDNFLKAAGC